MKAYWQRIPGVALLAMASLSFVPQLAEASVVAVIGGNSNSSITAFLNNNGHTATDFGFSVPASLVGFDAAILLRANGNATLRSFVLGGGLLITEWDASDWALDVANLLNADDTGGSFVGTGTPVAFTPAGQAEGLSNGLGAAYSDGERTEFFRQLANIGSGVDILATRPGGTPEIIGGASGSGSTLIIGYDWADGFPSGSSASGTLLLNALNYNAQAVQAVPEPDSLALVLASLGALSLVGSLARKRQVTKP